MNLFHPFGLAPPSVPTDPVSTLRNHRQRATCQPPSLPAAAARQVCELNLPGTADATTAASWRTCRAGIPQTCAAYSGVNSA